VLEKSAAISAEHGRMVLSIAKEVLAGEIRGQKNYDAAIAHLEAPCDWKTSGVQPSLLSPLFHGHALGACCWKQTDPQKPRLLLGRSEAAIGENGWALFGLMQALKAQVR